MSQLTHDTATIIAAGFTAYHTQFRSLTRRANRYFLQREWGRIHTNAAERLDLYSELVGRTLGDVDRLLEGELTDKFLWREIKRDFGHLIEKRGDKEIAQSFFNSITRRVFDTVGVNADLEFFDDQVISQPLPYGRLSAVCRAYRPTSYDTLTECIKDILLECGLTAPFCDFNQAAVSVAIEMADKLPPITRLDMIIAPLFRGRLAYLIGRLMHAGGTTPLAITLTHDTAGLQVDAVLLTEDELSIVFSFAHTYFHVETGRPTDLVAFLQSILPKKPVSDLWISIGYNRHGKTILYRELQRHLRRSNDRFVIAPGIPGMVMLVFTLPSHEIVFKVIKDEFDYPKQSTRKDVMSSYRLVFKHDRGGRLLDAQSFEHLTFQKERFDPQLLEKLLEQAADSVRLDGNKVVFDFLYIERRVTPLNLYLSQAEPAAQEAATLDYGQAIRDLARTNIFPGDLFLKNFGVTRHGRVLFYDYDELCFVTDCHFRDIPPALSWEAEMSDQPWYAVQSGDVFPEQFVHFLGLKPHLKKLFIAHHRALLTAAFWQDIQKQSRQNKLADIRPYPPERRLIPSIPPEEKL